MQSDVVGPLSYPIVSCKSLEHFTALNRSSIAFIMFPSAKSNIVLRYLASILLHKAFGKYLRVAEHSGERIAIDYTYKHEYVLYLLRDSVSLSMRSTASKIIISNLFS